MVFSPKPLSWGSKGEESPDFGPSAQTNVADLIDIDAKIINFAHGDAEPLLRQDLGDFIKVPFSPHPNMFIEIHGTIMEVSLLHKFQMGVSKNRGTPKWMVYNGKPY